MVSGRYSPDNRRVLGIPASVESCLRLNTNIPSRGLVVGLGKAELHSATTSVNNTTRRKAAEMQWRCCNSDQLPYLPNIGLGASSGDSINRYRLLDVKLTIPSSRTQLVFATSSRVHPSLSSVSHYSFYYLFPSSFCHHCLSPSMPIYTPSTDSDSDADSPNMELIYFSNEFPREDLQDLFRRLHNHSKDKNQSILAHFIQEATWVIKDEIRRLPTELKQLIPPFETILSWVENTELRESLICGAVDGVLLIVIQLATYIG